MAGGAAGCVMGIQDDCENPTGETPFKLAYGSEGIIPAEVHMANHRAMMYQDKDNEEQFRLNLNLINEVRTDADERTARYKNQNGKVQKPHG